MSDTKPPYSSFDYQAWRLCVPFYVDSPSHDGIRAQKVCVATFVNLLDLWRATGVVLDRSEVMNAAWGNIPDPGDGDESAREVAGVAIGKMTASVAVLLADVEDLMGLWGCATRPRIEPTEVQGVARVVSRCGPQTMELAITGGRCPLAG